VQPPSMHNEEVTPEIDRIVIKALQKDPANRYQTAGEMARDLDQVLYSFRPTPTSADLAIYMHRLAEPAASHIMEPEPVAAPAPAPVKPAPLAAPAPIAAAVAAPAAWEAPAAAEPPAKKLPIVPIAIVAVLLIGAGAFFMMKRSSSTASAPAVTTTAAKPLAAPPSAVTASGVTTTAATSSAALTSAAPTGTGIDQAKVDEEVRKRLEAERLRIEQQQAKATAAAANAPRPVVAAPQPVAQQTPAPVVAAPAPVPPPVAPAPQPAAAESRPAPAPQPAAAEAPRTREGDLVPAGTEGLSPAHIIRQALPIYPPLARQQRVEGTVLVNALIGETGQVLDAKVLAGVNRPVGINESALQTVRRSAFSPGTKDGVRVKSWTTVRVDFKL
jgi:TonB family protein